MKHYAQLLLLLVATFAPLGCSKPSDPNPELKVSSPDTQLPDASSFADVLGPQLTITIDGQSIPIDVHSLGDLPLPSGQVVASDGFISYASKPFARAIKPGAYPLTIAVARIPNNPRVAFAQLRFSPTPVAKWELATTDGQDIQKLKPDEVFAYGVDSGTGSFADPAALGVIGDATDKSDAFFKRIFNAMGGSSCGWVRIDTPHDGSDAIFTSGWGDGAYPSYFGLDAAGNVVTLVTNFNVADWDPLPARSSAPPASEPSSPPKPE